jgi:DNA-binding XRE family transcriptional regulator
MKYTYLIVNNRKKYNTDQARIERRICGIKQYQIADAIKSSRQSVIKWESGSRGKLETESFIAYRRIARIIHNHASEDYWPCPTLIRLAPEKWTDHILALMLKYMSDK